MNSDDLRDVLNDIATVGPIFYFYIKYIEFIEDHFSNSLSFHMIH
jgi:hypothetical protein